MLKIPTEIPEVETKYTFPLDTFQKQAIYAIQHDENVLVTAKTGSGKTLVGEYQIEHSLAKGKRAFYTTPIKSLTNQKFSDLKAIYGPRVGVMTGDIKFSPHADVVVMTTEILRNLLFKQGASTEALGATAALSMDGVDSVVFDEVHYINDPDRGKVWEECLMLLPPSVNIVMLSATIDSPERFAQWVGDLKKRPVHLISTQHRVVPLKHCIPGAGADGEHEVVMDARNRFHRETYMAYLRKLKRDDDEQRKLADAVRSREDGDAPVERTVRIQSFIHRMNRLVESLSLNSLLPALFFVFSRKQCEQYAASIEGNLLSERESADVANIVRFHLSRHKELENIGQYYALLCLLKKGVAFHHSGLLPLLKEIVEVLFSRGLVKVLFATETFAVGINMPTKTVVFTSYRKVDDSGQLRMLRAHEYIQMAGRAGRRGKDTEGLVLYLPAHRPESVEDVQAMMTGSAQTLESKMDFHYDFIIKCLQSGGKVGTDDMARKSFWYSSRLAEIEALEDQNRDLEDMTLCLDSAEFHNRETIEENMRSSAPSDRKEWQRKLDTWKNTHFGPRWENGWKHFKQCKVAQGKMAYNTALIEKLRHVEMPFIQNLCCMKFIQDGGKLSDTGVMASEINEGHPLLMSVGYSVKLCEGLGAPEICALLACFVDPDPHDYSPDVPREVGLQYQRLLAIRDHLRSQEVTKSPEEYWEVTPFWMAPIYEWAKGATGHGKSLATICITYELYEGNFVKAILKVQSILQEWTTLATYKQDLEMLEVLRDFTLVRDVVVPASLYLTM
uniref:Helicase n=1 Tax=viral metagenome TaxID=1070528 RepID=A0A6C0HLD4_9ZZZZ